MARVLGVEGARLANVGRYNPQRHKGVDVFAPPGSKVYVPRNSTLRIVQASFDPKYYKGQGRGWLTMCGKRYGFVAAHMRRAPELGTYEAGEQYGVVSGNVSFTPHIHIALAYDHMPPPGELDPIPVWRECVAGAAATDEEAEEAEEQDA